MFSDSVSAHKRSVAPYFTFQPLPSLENFHFKAVPFLFSLWEKYIVTVRDDSLGARPPPACDDGRTGSHSPTPPFRTGHRDHSSVHLDPVSLSLGEMFNSLGIQRASKCRVRRQDRGGFDLCGCQLLGARLGQKKEGSPQGHGESRGKRRA